MYKIIYKKKAVKALAKCPREIALRFRSAFEGIAAGNQQGLSIKQLEGLDGFRLRIGSYRAIYEFDNGALIVTVFNVGSRGGIYK
jgi:mRNA interferase RelE/StbE